MIGGLSFGLEAKLDWHLEWFLNRTQFSSIVEVAADALEQVVLFESAP
jgi:hypothetical protein